MPSYDWHEHEVPLSLVDWRSSWRQRFPAWAVGIDAASEGDPITTLEKLIELRRTSSQSAKCVFVSHRQADVAEASRVAYLACQKGFDYWLDVYDPTLAALPPATSPEQAAAIASVIEMGLL